MSDTTPDVKPTKPKNAKTADAIDQLQALMDGMTDEQRERLERAGVNIPLGSLSSITSDTFTWGVRCTHCNKIALYFVGDRWEHNGVELDAPPPLPHNRIMWTQQLAPSQIDRAEPRCQHCGVPVALNPDKSFMRERQRVIRISEFETSRDASFDRKFVRETLKKVAAATTDQADLSHSYNMPDEKASETIARQRGPDAVGEVALVASMTGADQFRPLK